jgi:serine/threonine protein kinase
VVAAPLISKPGASLVIGRRLGVYQVQTLLGTGGMGEVYRARDTKLGRDVAIKILPRLLTSDSERLVRFEREARMLAALNHPNIVAIYGFEELDGVRALVLELVEGRRWPTGWPRARSRSLKPSASRNRLPGRPASARRAVPSPPRMDDSPPHPSPVSEGGSALPVCRPG